MSLIGFIMNMIEPRYEDYIRRRRSRLNINEIMHTGNHIKKVNFDRVKLGYIDSKVKFRALDQIATMDNMLNKSFQDTVRNETILHTSTVIDLQLYNEDLNVGGFIFKKSKVLPYDT
jgi:hypothetical protein